MNSHDADPGSRSRAGARTLAFSLFLLAFVALWTLRATVLYDSLDARIDSEPLRHVFSNLVKLALWVLPALAYTKWLDGEEKPLAALHVTTTPARGSLLAPGLLSTAFLLATAFLRLRRGVDPSGKLVPLVSTTISAMSEEILFRGFVLENMRRRARALLAHGATAILFVLAHWPHWLWTGHAIGAVLADSAGILGLALLLGYVAARTGSIWPAVFLHAANNVLVGLAAR